MPAQGIRFHAVPHPASKKGSYMRLEWHQSSNLSTSPYLHQGHRPCLKSWKLGFAFGHADSSCWWCLPTTWPASVPSS
jgi:hypothetical protein